MRIVSSNFQILGTYSYLNTVCLLSYSWLLLAHVMTKIHSYNLLCSEALCAIQNSETKEMSILVEDINYANRAL